jgi:hypothetical protein
MTDPVELQLEAYNARDVERFVACFTDDVVVEDGEGQRLLTGHSEFRASYAAMFASSPALHCRVVSRARAGRYVVDEERVVGRGPDELHVLVVYRLRGDLIEAVRLLKG